MTTLSTPFLDRLLADGVITASHHDAARARLAHAASEPFDSLGSALFWLAGENIVTDEEMEEMEEVSLRDAAFASNATRVQALDEYEDCLFAQFDREEAERIRATPWHQRHRPWLIAGGVAMLAAGLVWFLQPARAARLRRRRRGEDPAQRAAHRRKPDPAGESHAAQGQPAQLPAD